MAVFALHFSQQYKEKLFTKQKMHTIVAYPLHLSLGQKLLVYISKKGTVEKSQEAQKIGVVTITKAIMIKVQDITNDNAKIMHHESRKGMISSMKKWYQITNKSIITSLEFEFAERGKHLV